MIKKSHYISLLSNKAFFSGIFIFLCLIPFSFYSQNLNDTTVKISEVKINADRIFLKENAGVKKTYVDTAVLKSKINQSLSDILSENTTLIIKNYGRGALSVASFRGTASSHTKVSWNGINMNSPMLGMVDFSLIPVYIIDEIRLDYGSASLSKQSGGLGGHIDIKNTVNWNNKTKGDLLFGFGSYSTFDTFGKISFGNNKIRSKTGIYRSSSKNDYSFINKNIIDQPIQKNENADYKKYGFIQEMYFRISPKILSSCKIWMQNANRSIPTVLSYEGSDFSSFSEELTDSLNLDPENVRGIKNTQTDQTLKASGDIKYYGKNTEISILSGFDHQELDYKMTVFIGGYDQQKAINSGSKMLSSYNKFNVKHKLTENISLLFSADYNHYDISTFDTVKYIGYTKKRGEFSTFAGINLNVLKRINFSANLRKDYLKSHKIPFMWNTGISIKPFLNKELIFKLSAARNYKQPSLNDLYWQPGGNPDLFPEEGYSYETGILYILQKKNFSSEIEITSYYSDINHWIIWLPAIKGFWEPINIKKVKSYGIESHVKFHYTFKKYSFLSACNYAFTKSLNYGEPLVEGDESVGMQLPYIPVHSGNIFMKLIRNKFFINYQYDFQGIRNLLSSNKQGYNDDSDYFGQETDIHPFYRLYAQHLNHLSIGRNFYIKKIQLITEFKIYNLFNETYRNALNRFMPGRNYVFMLKIHI